MMERDSMIREVLQERTGQNRGMMSECRFDGVIEKMEFENLTDQVEQVAQNECTGLAHLKGRSRVSRSTRSYDVSCVEQKAPRSVS